MEPDTHNAAHPVVEIPRLEIPHAQDPESFQASFEVARVPTAPGCYLMCDAKGKVIYVGKAINLRARIRTYINEQDSRHTVKFLMKRVAHMEFLVTTNEKEALLLENSLIKQYHPHYNIRLRDDKTYVSLRIAIEEDFPRITVVRRYRRDGARYFGPYSSSLAVRETLKQLYRMFPIRRCSDSVMKNRTRPCLYCQMGQCPSPCTGQVTREQYHEMLDQVILVLEGRTADLEKALSAQIERHAEDLEFEKAAQLRDRLYALRHTVERQRTVAVPGAEDRDVAGYYAEGRYTEIQLIFFRGGKMVGGRSYSFERCEMPVEELISSFLLQYYTQSPMIPDEVLLPVVTEDAETLSELLGEERGRRVVVHCPQRGEKHALVELAMRNAQTSFEEKRLAERATQDMLEQVRRVLHLDKPPARIECFDISNIQGERAVGSMSVFENGLPSKGRYRRYAIKTVEGQDDFAMLREVLTRRFSRALDEKDLPDLVLIDGGRGQLGVAMAVFEDLGIENLAVAGIAKSRVEGDTRSPERFFLPHRANPVVPAQNSPVVHYLARIRDEAHRFAITYHRKQRDAGTLRTALEDIPGVGPKRARLLLRKMGSLAKVRRADAAAIAALPGFSDKLAEAILQHLNP